MDFKSSFDRAFKSCRRADARLRKIFKNLHKMFTFERKIGKTDIKKKLAQFEKLFKFLHVFMAF